MSSRIHHYYSIFSWFCTRVFSITHEHTRPIFMALAKFAYFKFRPKLHL